MLARIVFCLSRNILDGELRSTFLTILFCLFRNILDGELLSTFLMMSSTERQELCRKIGATVELILDDLMEIDRVTNHF